VNRKKQNEQKVADRAFNVLNFFGIALKEIYSGLRKDSIPAHKWCYPGIVVAFVLFFGFDERLLAHYGYHLHIPLFLRILLVYTALFSGWLLWGIRRAALRNSLLEELTRAFEECKWKCNKKYPSFIEDSEVDEHLRKLRLKTNGVTFSEFESGREKFESMLNVSVVKIVIEENDKQYLDILYTTEDLPKSPVLEHPDRFTDGEIPIGISHEGQVRVNFRDVGHIMVAGQTGGGKSNFLKLVVSTLSENNGDADVIFLDFKGGMESADLKNQIGNMRDNVYYFEGTRACVSELCKQGSDLASRLFTLTELGVADFDAYRKRKLKKESDPESGKTATKLKRLYIVIDEMAQLYSREPGIDKKELEGAREAANRIARQGRAAGVHMIAATQKPDASSFDQTVKSNMPGILCFPMVNQQSSVSALGSKRAFELNPNIKGRAVWKFGSRMEEVQTYLFT
jgi:hypothetical protein